MNAASLMSQARSWELQSEFARAVDSGRNLTANSDALVHTAASFSASFNMANVICEEMMPSIISVSSMYDLCEPSRSVTLFKLVKQRNLISIQSIWLIK